MYITFTLKETLTLTHIIQLIIVNLNKPSLIITHSHVDFHRLFSCKPTVKSNKLTVFLQFVVVTYCPWHLLKAAKPFQCSTTVTHQSSTFETQTGDPPPQSHISLFFSLATITINSSTSEGSEEQLINHMHPLLVSWRPSWLYWSVSLIPHRFDSLFSHPFS